MHSDVMELQGVDNSRRSNLEVVRNYHRLQSRLLEKHLLVDIFFTELYHSKPPIRL